MKIEFTIGDKVIFDAYGKEIPAIVKSIVPAYQVCFDRDDDRVFYELHGAGKIPLHSVTTGKSIKESRYFSRED